MDDLRTAQERRLVEQAAASGSYAGLMYFYLACGQHDRIHALGPSPGDANTDDALAWRLMTGDDTPEAFAALAADAGGRGSAWFAYTLAKRLLHHGLLRETLRLAKDRVLRNTYDVGILNLAAQWAMHSGDGDLARGIIERSLNRNPYQADLVAWLEALDTGGPSNAEPYLDLAPRTASVAFYIPVYNVERHIRQVLEGILSQWHPLDELLVVDDKTPDASMDIAREYPVRILAHEENLGLAAARNTAFRNTSCNLVAAVDTDAIPAPDFLCHALMAFENASERLAGVGGMLTEAYSETLPDAWRAAHLPQHWGAGRQYPPPFLFGANAVFRRDAVLALGGYTDACRNNAEDVDLCNRLAAAGHALCYTPDARAQHQRQDSLPSLLRTRWGYELRYREVNGFFSSIDALLSHLPQLLDASLVLLAEDVQTGHPEFYPVDVLCFIYDALAGARLCADHGRCAASEAAGLQRAIRALFSDYPAFFATWIEGACAGLMVSDPDVVREPEGTNEVLELLRTRLSVATSFVGNGAVR